MRRPGTGAVGLSVLGLTALGGSWMGSGAPAAADPIAQCTPTAGVIVAVDFAAWGGNIERGCDATLTTGYDALHAAGFTTAGDGQDGPEFICRIDDDPPPTEQACVATPPVNAYWSYWHADAGQDTWSYSLAGAAGYHPPPGSVDAWTFGATDIDGTTGKPSFPPSAVRAGPPGGPGPTTTTTGAPPPPPTTSTSTTPPGPATAGTGSPGAGRSSPLPTGSARGPDGTQPTGSSSTIAAPASSTVPKGAAHRGGAGAMSNPKIVDAAPASITRRATGSPRSLLVGVAILVALAGAAAMVAWRRRRLG